MQTSNEPNKQFVCRADFSSAFVLPAYFNCAAAQNWFEITFNETEFVCANNDNFLAGKKKSKHDPNQPGVVTHFRYVTLNGSEVSLRWNPEITERSLTFKADYDELSQNLASCTQKVKASLTLYQIISPDPSMSSKYILMIGDGTENEGGSKIPIVRVNPSSFSLVDPGSEIFFDLPIVEAVTMIKLFQKEDNIKVALYQGEFGNGVVFFKSDFQSLKTFGYVGPESIEVAKYNITHKLLMSMLKSPIAKTSVIHFCWREGFQLKLWLLLSNWGKMISFIYV